MTKLSGALAIFGLMAFSFVANATPVTFLLTGQLPEAQSEIWSHEPWLAYLTIDDVPVLTAPSGEQKYVADSEPFGLWLTFPRLGLSVVSDSVQVVVSNGAGGVLGPLDFIWILADGGTSGTEDFLHLRMFWADLSGPSYTDAISSTALFPQPDLFSEHCYEDGCRLRAGTLVNGGGYSSMDNLSVTRLPFVIPVPARSVSVVEPSGTALLGFGLLAVLIAGRREWWPMRRLRLNRATHGVRVR